MPILSIVSFKPTISIQSLAIFISVLHSCTSHIAFTMDLCYSQNSVLLSFRLQALISGRIASFMYLLRFCLRGNLFPCNNSSHSLNITHPYIVLTIIGPLYTPLAHTLLTGYLDSYCFHFTTSIVFLLYYLSNIPVTFLSRKISCKLLDHPFHFCRYTVDSLTTLY